MCTAWMLNAVLLMDFHLTQESPIFYGNGNFMKWALLSSSSYSWNSSSYTLEMHAMPTKWWNFSSHHLCCSSRFSFWVENFSSSLPLYLTYFLAHVEVIKTYYNKLIFDPTSAAAAYCSQKKIILRIFDLSEAKN